MSKRTTFTKEYKLAAIQPLLEGATSVSQQALDLGVGRTELQRWLGEYRRLGEAAFPGSGHQAGTAAELARLTRENENLRLDCEILKKAQAAFSKRQP
jgi:transposase